MGMEPYLMRAPSGNKQHIPGPLMNDPWSDFVASSEFLEIAVSEVH